MTSEELAFGQRFLERGYVVIPAESPVDLARIRDRMVGLAADRLGIAAPKDGRALLDGIGAHLSVADLNAFRLAMIAGINAEPWLRSAYYALARRALASLVGNELAMQRSVNLSIQLPGDESSLLPAHTDTWSGDSPFEAVLWVPLVDCHDTKAMFLLPPTQNERFATRLGEYRTGGLPQLMQDIEPYLEEIAVPYGSVLLFNQNLIHGNRVNRETTTRWSFNCRFKGLFAPYADKRLGEFFEPITIRPMTRLGLAYKLPGGFS